MLVGVGDDDGDCGDEGSGGGGWRGPSRRL